MRYLHVLLLNLLTLFAHAQSAGTTNTRYFDIRIAGVKVGELKATRTITDTVTFYRLESKVKVWLVVSVEMDHKIETVYHGKHLFSSVSVSGTNNGKYTSTIKWKDGYYQIQVDSYQYTNSTPIYELVECNIVRFYFDEPVDIQKTLADSYGTLAVIKKVSPGNYEVESHGSVNHYYYKDGSFIRGSLFSKVRYEVIARNDKTLASSGIHK